MLDCKQCERDQQDHKCEADCLNGLWSVDHAELNPLPLPSLCERSISVQGSMVKAKASMALGSLPHKNVVQQSQNKFVTVVGNLIVDIYDWDSGGGLKMMFELIIAMKDRTRTDWYHQPQSKISDFNKFCSFPVLIRARWDCEML